MEFRVLGVACIFRLHGVCGERTSSAGAKSQYLFAATAINVKAREKWTGIEYNRDLVAEILHKTCVKHEPSQIRSVAIRTHNTYGTRSVVAGNIQNVKYVNMQQTAKQSMEFTGVSGQVHGATDSSQKNNKHYPGTNCQASPCLRQIAR